MGRAWRSLKSVVLAASITLTLGSHTEVRGEAILTFAPASIAFDSVAVGGAKSEAVLIRNTGSSSTTVTSVLAVSGDAQLTVEPTAFALSPNQDQVVTFTFAPTRAGDLADAFKFVSEATVFGTSAPSIVIPVTGVGTGPRITFDTTRLVFESSAIGVAATDTLTIGNAGTGTLGVVSFLAGSSDFDVSATPFNLAPGETQSVPVTYTPSAAAPVRDSLTVLSDSPDANLSYVTLDALETPTNPRTARISLLRTDGTATPAQGDSVRIALFMIPNADTIRGAEAFVAYDDTLFEPRSGPSGPFRRAALTQSPGFQINVVEAKATGDAAAHMSVFFSQNKRAADTLAILVFDVLKPVEGDHLIQVLTENPLRNSNFLSPENLSFALPGTLKVSLGNRAPEMDPFRIITFDEDTDLVLDLSVRASDRETASDGLVWTFEDAQNLFTPVVTMTDTGQTLVLTPPAESFGVYDILAVVTDDGGLSDTSAVILDVRSTNDPPNAAVYSAPADSSEGQTSPVTLEWSGSDPEGDEVTFEVRLGTTPEGLQPVAQNLTQPEHEATGLGASTTYFWQIVTIDEGGERTEGEIRRFTTAPDETPPVFVTSPRDTLATPTSVRIIWDTDETSTSVIQLGFQPTLSDTATFGNQGNDVFLVLRHEVDLTGLESGATYYYRARSRDLFGNIANSPVSSFTTEPPLTIPGDFDGDRNIGFPDFLSFAETYNLSVGDTGFNSLGDFDGDNTVDFSDFLAFASVFGTSQ